MKRFTQYIQDSRKDITIVVSQFSVPTTQHEYIFEAAHKTSLKENYRIYVLNDSDRILEHSLKVKYIRKMFPRHARSVILDESINNIFDVLRKLYLEGFTTVNLVCEKNKVAEYDTLTNKYDGHKSRGGFYKFDGGVNVISSGILSESSSQEKIIAAAENNDFQTFSKGLPSGFKDGKDLFNDVRKGMGLTESHDFRSHIQLHPVSEDREAYVAGNLFEKGDNVVITASEEVGTISFLGSNYVIVETSEGKKYRKWISDVEPLSDDVKSITYDPKIDRAIDRLINRKKYANAVKAYMQSGKDLRKIAQIFAIDYRNLKMSVDKVLNEINQLTEGENLDRVQQEKQDALDKLEQEYERKIERAKQADEVQDEQEKRRQEAEDERDSEPENQNESSVKSFRQFRIDEVLKKVKDSEGKSKWAMVSKDDPSKVLQYYDGQGKPSQDWINKVERRVQYFKHNKGD